MKSIRKIIEIDEDLCNGCGSCTGSCDQAALHIVDGRAKLLAEEYCDGLGACLEECPTGALTIKERKAEHFDEKAAAHHLALVKNTQEQVSETLPCGCPSTHLQTFAPRTACEKVSRSPSDVRTRSALGHWPVQIRLVPAEAPFLKNADLLVIADCTAVAYPDFHRDFLTGKVVLM